ncbi:MAG: alpha/beta fold hydrolase [Betaproteobacteria bacterium]|nr:alpha/beta fold hydrolase [Betaproteobacteria bacterium]
MVADVGMGWLMLSRLIIGLLLLEGAFYIWLGFRLMGGGWSGWAMAAVVVGCIWFLRLGFSLFTALVAGWLRLCDKRRMPLQPNVAATWADFKARLVTYTFSQAFPGWAMGPEPVVSGQGRPILLVHGYFSSRGMFFRFRQRLAAAKVGPVYTITLEPIYGSIDRFAAQLAQRVEAICRDTGHQQMTIIAHSMGGLVTRAYMAKHGSARVAQLVTLGSPHHGTRTAALGLGRCAQQMRANSSWLKHLQQQEAAGAYALPPTLSIYTLNDDIVYPPETGALAWAENVPVSGVGHVSLLFDAAVAMRVIAAVA